MKALVILIVLVALSGSARSFNNINVQSCSTAPDCLRCLSRSSPNLERCQQLYFYVTYTTSGNQVEIDRYCNGDCPIILATANYFCGSTDTMNELLRRCPNYNVQPTGYSGVQRNSSCVPTTGNCLHCIGDERMEAVRCLQLYMLATAANHTSKYSGSYCDRNCPTVLSSYTWYCNIPSLPATAYSYCERNEEAYCGQLSEQFGSELRTSALRCSSNCSSDACSLAIAEYGCCLRRVLGNTCSRIPTCTQPVEVRPVDYNINFDCPLSFCSQCLARNNDLLERCEQQYTYLSYLDDSADSGVNVQGTFDSDVRQDFCNSECPIFLLTSDLYCGKSDRIFPIYETCPSYSVIPRVSVDVRASYSNGRMCPVVNRCRECVTTQSPEPLRCFQLYQLTLHPNRTDYYLNIYCPSNCPLTLATSNWYCDLFTPVNTFFDRCMRRNVTGNTEFCATLMARDQAAYNLAISSCRQNCTGLNCINARNIYGCCLNMDQTIQQQCNIPACDIMTAGVTRTMATPFIIAALMIFTYFIIN